MIFNKSENGTSEIKELLGFINADLSFNNLKTDIDLAEESMRSLLGNAMFDYMEEFYNSVYFDTEPVEGEEPEIDTVLWTKIVKYAQAAIALYAYREFVESGDLMHGNKGRTMQVTETEKTPFEWMIERNNKSMTAKAHRLTDRLLSLLDDNKEDEKLQEVYFNSESFTLTHNNLIQNSRVFNFTYPINDSRRFYLQVAPFIREVEDTRIIPVLTADRYNTLLSALNGSETISAEDKTLITLARIPTVLYTMSLAAQRLAVEVLPEGVFQNFVTGTQNSKNPAPEEFKNAIAMQLNRQADIAFEALQQYLAKVAATEAGQVYDAGLPTDRHNPDNQFIRV